MKKILKSLLILALATPVFVYGAVAVGWTATSTTQGWIMPNLVNNILQTVVGNNFIATSTTASIFPYASTTVLSASTLCLSTDCRTSWISPGGSNTQVQYNSSGSFAGNANFTYNDGTSVLSVPTLDGGTTLNLKATGATANPSISLIGNSIHLGMGDGGAQIQIGDIGGGNPSLLSVTSNNLSTGYAFLDTSLLTSGDKTFSFPPETGQFALGTGSAGNCASWSTAYTLTTTGSPCSSGGLTSYDAFTHPALGQSATTSLMVLNGNASTTQLTTTGSTYLATSGGNVGIGTTAPTNQFQVGSTFAVDTANTYLKFENNILVTSGRDILLRNIKDTALTGTLIGLGSGSNAGLTFSPLGTGNSVFSTGNVGIGTTSPSYKLDINGDLHTYVASNNSLHVDTGAGANAWTYYEQAGVLKAAVGYRNSNAGLTFYENGADGMVLKSGNVGIGTTSPYSMLSVAGQVVAKNYIATSTTATSTFSGNVLISPTNDQSGFAYGGQLLKLVDTQASAPVQVVTQNKSTGASALSSFTLGNSNTTFPSNPFLASYYGGMYLASANWNTAGFNGLKPNGLAVFASDGDVSIGSASSNSASSSIRFFVGGNNGGGCTTFDSCGQDAVIAGGTAFLGLGTSTPKWRASIYATTSPQIALLGQNTDNIWTLRGIGNSFYIATSSPTTYATSTSPAFSINANGQLRNPFLKSCDTIDTDANGNMTCGTDSGSSATATTTWKSLSQAWVYPDVTGSEACKAPAEYADGRRIHTLKMEYFSLNSSGDIYTLSATSTPYACNGYSSANATSTTNSSTEQFVTVSGNATSFAGLMGSTAKQTTFINTVVAMATSTTFTGVELDIEGYGSWSQANTTLYYTFLDNLGKRLHQYGKKLMVDVPPVWNSSIQSSGSGDEWDTANSTNYYKLRYEEFNNIAVDYIVIMAYDYHFDYGGGSSIAPLKWVDEIITFAQSKIQDNDKIVIGMPAYGYYDTTGGFAPTAQTYDQMTLLTGFGTATRDSTSGEMKWTNAGSSYVYNDATSLLIKRDAIEKRGIRRISVWHLGGNQWFTAGSRIELGNLPAPTVPLWFSPFASTTYATTTIFTPLNVAIGTTSANSTYSATFSVKGVMGAITAIVQFFTTSGTKVMEILDSGIVNLLGQWNFGDATSLEVPNGTAPVFDQIGQVGFDTTDNDILIATTTANTPVVIPTMQKLWSATIASTSVDFVSGGRIPLPDLRDGYIIKEIYCHVESGTSVVINLDTSAGGANTDTVTCATTQTSDTAMSANYTLSAGSIMDLEIGTITGAVDYVTFSVYGVKIRE